MPRLLLLAATTGYQTRVFADAARRLGYELVLGTDRCHVLEDPWGDHAIPVRFEEPEASAEALAAAGPFDGIMAVADRPTFIAALAAQKLGLPYNSPDAVLAARDKYRARQCFEAAGLPVPEFFRIPVDDDPSEAARHVPYPCVLKPLGLSASRGVIRANDRVEFAAAFHRIVELLEEPDIRRMREDRDRYIQVESYIPGAEYAIEGLLSDGELHVLAVFDKPDPLEGPYFEETIYLTPSRAPASTQTALIDSTRRAVRALGLTHGPIHAELRLNQRGAWLLEVAARPIGGLCAKTLRFNGEMPLEELLLRHAVGRPVEDPPLDGQASGVMMIPVPQEGMFEETEGLEQAGAVQAIEEIIITAKQGQKLLPWPEGSSYLGFIFARAASAEAVESALRAAHSKLRFRLATTLPVF